MLTQATLTLSLKDLKSKKSVIKVFPDIDFPCETLAEVRGTKLYQEWVRAAAPKGDFLINSTHLSLKMPKPPTKRDSSGDIIDVRNSVS